MKNERRVGIKLEKSSGENTRYNYTRNHKSEREEPMNIIPYEKEIGQDQAVDNFRRCQDFDMASSYQ